MQIVHPRRGLWSLLLSCFIGYGGTPVSADAPPRVSARNSVELSKLVGSDVVVHGHVDRTSKSKNGHQFLNFQASELSIVCLSDDARKFKDGEPASQFRDRDIEVRGHLQRYEQKLQIKLTEPDQIKIVSRRDPATSEHSPFQLQRVGDDSWLSPAGLRYAGQDPEGLNRLDHVLRHAQDIPDRDGSHGVFDGGRNQALAVIDEAWKRIQEQHTRPVTEGSRSSYTVHMGRRIGYLGGRTGKQRNHPPLRRVFIVVKTGTQEIVTAFPK